MRTLLSLPLYRGNPRRWESFSPWFFTVDVYLPLQRAYDNEDIPIFPRILPLWAKELAAYCNLMHYGASRRSDDENIPIFRKTRLTQTAPRVNPRPRDIPAKRASIGPVRAFRGHTRERFSHALPTRIEIIPRSRVSNERQQTPRHRKHFYFAPSDRRDAHDREKRDVARVPFPSAQSPSVRRVPADLTEQ